MRQYRGRRLDNGKWVKGSLISMNDGSWIIPQSYDCVGISSHGCISPGANSYAIHGMIEVDPATESQSTGLRDKKGVEIWEGDMIHAVHKSGSGTFSYTGAVAWDIKYAAWGVAYVHPDAGDCTEHLMNVGVIKVTGSIHDNPTLTEGKEI